MILDSYMGGLYDSGVHTIKRCRSITRLSQKPTPNARCRTVVRTSVKVLLEDSTRPLTHKVNRSNIRHYLKNLRIQSTHLR